MPRKTTGILRTIPATIKLKGISNERRRVCGYARVSTENEEQQTSYKSQVDYYTSFIKSNPNWEFVGLYSDEGISATNTKKRDGFNKMVSDAISGKIDLIITKSISRFARNTVDSLSTIRKLKEKNVEVFFEKENIYTFDSKGELMISLLSSLAQDESRSISENTTWGIRKRFSDGYVRMRFNNFLGYTLGKDGKAKIVKEEAKVVKLIYKLFMQGYGYKPIARILMNKGIKSPGGCDIWRDNTVKSILTNERYIGDALLQKNFTVDFLNKKMKKNEGEVPQYYIENDHDAIISKELFNAVSERIRLNSNNNTIAGKLYCGECGGKFGRKTWHSNDRYKKQIYQCNDKYSSKNKEKHKCINRNIEEETIKSTFVKALNQVIGNKDEIIANIEQVLKFIDTSKLVSEKTNLENKLIKMVEVINQNVYANATRANNRNIDLNAYEELKNRINELQLKIDKANERKAKLELYIKDLKKTGIIKEFSMDYWGMFLERMTIYKDRIECEFIGGNKITL